MIWNIDPIALNLGAIQIHWYGITFALGLLSAYTLGEYIFKKEGKDTKLLESFFIYLIIGITIGARLAHVLFYDFDYYKNNPLEILYVWHGGLASHGGIVGAILAMWFWCKRYKIDFLWMFARVAMATMLVAAFIRVGNFFNSEIVGLPTDSIFAVVFERVDNIPRHPVVLYEAIGYFLIFLISFYLYKKLDGKKFTQITPGFILTFGFLTRFILEYFKTPQSEFYKELPFSMGQILSIPFIIIGLFWFILGIYKSTKKSST